MKPKVVITKQISEDIVKYIENVCEVLFLDQINELNYPRFLQQLRHADGLLTTPSVEISTDLLDQAENLKIICNIAVGYDNFNIPELTSRHIMAANTQDAPTESTADLIFGLLLATARRIPELDRYVNRGYWDKPIEPDKFGMDVHHKVLGIIGMGRIGSAIAKRAHCGFGMGILYHNRSRNEESESKYNAKFCTLHDLLTQSDFVCMMAPLTEETRNLIGAEELALMKKTAILIVGSRGGTVVEKDVAKALENGGLWAAGFDVFEQEPLRSNDVLTKFSNVVTLPHVGASTYDTRYNMVRMAAQNMVMGLTGKRPPCLLNPDAFIQR